MADVGWMLDELIRSKRRNAAVPPHARMVVCGPGMTTTRKPKPAPTFRSDNCGSSIDCAWVCPGCPAQTFAQGTPLCQQELDPRGSE